MYSFTVNKDEKIIKKGLASLHIEDATLSGALYLTNIRLVFVGHILGGNAAKKEVSVPLTRIVSVKGSRTALIIPNAVDIVTTADEKLQLVLRDRRQWLTAIEQGLSSLK